ncbi:GNAT family N-acetyltransferase [Solicola gregarius]|uniref:GNAT family N-acetyltransferase n=1 Tax=Solicola gregarius TaxID=2908642 RepID=A0AA46THF8_9ACTN|nr:GNAT family protein [Solicola gregarius]UYM05422.1 GNAT family N-acetyltransferase [Solicola gregarius]
MNKVEVLTRRTERLDLRPVRDEDIDTMLAYHTDPRVYEWLLRTEIDPAAFRKARLGAVDDPRDYSVVAELDGRVIGDGMLEITDGMGQDHAPETQGCQALLGYILDPAYAGRGIATELATELLVMAFDDLGVRRVTAGCYVDNRASARILEKIGMRREEYAVKDSWHQTRGWIDGASYAILREEWQR